MDFIKLPPSVYQTMVTHALTHEREEIAGLLCSEVLETHIQIYAAIPLPRSLQQDNRVEVSDEQLASGVTKCEEISKKLGKQLNILGWYHSHPHITVHPSDTDLRTQQNFQLMDKRFFGLIVSVFDGCKDQIAQSIKICAFRSSSGAKPENRPPKLSIELLPQDLMAPKPLFDVSIDAWRSIPDTVFDEVAIAENNDSGCTRLLKTNGVVENVVLPMATCCEYLNNAMMMNTSE